jgi:hypothetical protein
MNRILGWLFPRWIPSNELRRAALRRIRLAPLVMVLVLTGIAARADELPSKPEPRTADRQFIIEAAAMGTAWTMDTISTHQSNVAHPNFYEVGYLCYGSRNTPKIMAAWAGVDLGVIAISYTWKRYVHNKYLAPLWRVPMAISTLGHTHAAIGNWRN